MDTRPVSSLGLRLLAAIVLPPVLVAVVLVFAASRLFLDDKELYTFDLATQTVDLLARNLDTKVKALQRQAARLSAPEAPFVTLEAQSKPAAGEPVVRNASHGGRALLRLRFQATGGPSTALLPPEDLLQVTRQGPAALFVVNENAEIVLHSDGKHVAARADAKGLLAQLRLFGKGRPRLGTKEVVIAGQPMLVAFARIEGGLAVLQGIPKAQVSAAAAPLIRTAAIVSAVTVLVTLLLGLLVSRRIVRPLQAMARQAEAFGRGEFDAPLEAGRAAGEVATLAASLREMSASLKRREEELERVQQRLLQTERLNAANRVIGAIASELTEPLEAGQLAAEKARAYLGAAAGPALEELVTALDRASSMVQKLRRLDASESDDAMSTIEADLPVSDVLVSARPMFAQRGIEVQMDAVSDPRSLRVNLKNLESALLDVLFFVSERAEEQSEAFVSVSNHAMPGGEPGVVIAVRYNGPALTIRERDRLLSPMAAVQQDGTLVLAVAALGIAEEGGRLTIEPTATGNMIQIRLPAVDASITDSGEQPVGGIEVVAKPPARDAKVTAGHLPVTAPSLSIVLDDESET